MPDNANDVVQWFIDNYTLGKLRCVAHNTKAMK